MPTRCPKCGSPNKYEEGINYACMMCGTRWPINEATPIIIKKEARDIDAADILKITEGKEMATRACRNCGRVRKIIGDDLDSGCYYAVRKLTKGTPEYNEALARAKKKFGDPNYKRGAGPKKLKKAKKPVRSMAVTAHSGNIAENAVIDQLTETRDQYLAKADKLTQAIELLSA